METPDTPSAEDIQLEKTGDWSAKYGYQVTKKTRQRPGLATDLFTPRRPWKEAGATAGATALENVDWNRMRVTKGLKGGDDKKVCLIDVAGQSMVLKGAYGTPESHVANTAFVGKLGMNGVKAPATRVLTDREKAGIVQKLAQGSVDEQQLARALQGGTGQLSELTTGKNLDSIFLNADVKAGLENADRMREKLVDADQDDAWAQGFAALVDATTKGSGVKKTPDAAAWAATKDPAVRKAALAYMGENCVKPGQKALADLLLEIDRGDDLKKSVKRAAEAEDARTQGQADLAKFAKSDEGIEAFAGVAAGDLLSGMHDRIVNAWNGGNFMFDPASGTLCCVDNSKNDHTDIRQAGSADWQKFFADNTGKNRPLVEYLFDRIYGKTANNSDLDAPGHYCDFTPEEADRAKSIIRGVLATAVYKIESDKSFGKAAQERAVALKAKLTIDSIMRVPQKLAAPPVKPGGNDALGKASRVGKSFFSKNKSTKRSETQQIKDDLRDGYITADVARQKLQALVNEKPELKNDRRGSKIEFLAAGMEFNEWLKTGNAELARFVQTNPPAEVWSADSIGFFLDPRQAVVQLWLAAYANDKNMSKLINDGWTAVVKTAKS